MHVHIVGDTAEDVARAKAAVEEIINNPEKNPEKEAHAKAPE